MNYFLDIAIRTCLYATLGTAANVVLGHGGLLSLSQGAVFGIAAYTYALLVVHLSWGFPAALCAATLMGMLVSAIVLRPTLRLRGDSFALASIGIQMLTIAALANLVDLTNGPKGIAGIPGPSIGLWGGSGRGELLFISAGICVGGILLVNRILALPYGRSLSALRDNETGAVSIGKNPLYYYVIAGIVSGGLFGAAGAVYSIHATYIDPMAFDLNESMKIVSVAILGGLGRWQGAILGAIFVVSVPELLTALQFAQTGVSALERVIYGLLLLGVLRFRPQGIVGRITLH